MPLQHQLGVTRRRIPELYAPILGARHDPMSMGRERNAKHEILVPLERHQTLPGSCTAIHAVVHAWVVKPPHTDSLVQTTRHQLLAAWAESNGID